MSETQASQALAVAANEGPAPDAAPIGRPPRRALGRWAAVLRTPVGASAGLLLLLVLVVAVLAPVLWGGRADTAHTDRILEGASGEHWVGTDNLGRDILARVLVATRLSVGLALAATVIAVVIGLVLGTAPLLLGRRAGRLVVAGVNIAVAFPGLLLALFFAVIFGIGMLGAVLAIGFAGAPAFARLTHTLAAGIADRDYVAAARLAGVGRVRLLLRHVLPNIGEPLVVNATIGAGGALLAFAGLSFLGLGVQAPAYDWGRLLQDGLAGIYIHPEGALAPGGGDHRRRPGLQPLRRGGGQGPRPRRHARDRPARSPGHGPRRPGRPVRRHDGRGPRRGQRRPRRARRPRPRRPRPVGALPGRPRSGEPGPRGHLRAAPRRGGRARRGVRVRQVAHRARARPPRRGARPGHGGAAARSAAPTC